MRDHSKHVEVSKDEAVRIITENCVFDPEQESVPVSECAGRVLAEDVYSKWNSPNVLTCRMDSVAVRWEDFENGMPDTSDWERGKQWQFANTGVAMPEGFDTAIVVEHVIFSENDTKVAFDSMPSAKFAGTSAVGSKLKAGDKLVDAGTFITPLVAAQIASGGNLSAEVIKKPKVAFLPTGNELVSLETLEKSEGAPVIPLGKNIESNSYMIAEKIRQWGGEPLCFPVTPDDKDALKDVLRKAAAEADIIVLNAGSSKGNDDWGIEMVEEIGKIFYHQTNHGPGHHSSFGVVDGVPVIGISGPPGGAAFTTDYYLYPAMMKYLGRDVHLKKIKVRLAASFSSTSNKEKWNNKGKVYKGEERPSMTGVFYSIRQMTLKIADDGVIEAYPPSGAHPSTEEAERADCYYVLPSWAGEPIPEVGDFIEVELRP